MENERWAVYCEKGGFSFYATYREAHDKFMDVAGTVGRVYLFKVKSAVYPLVPSKDSYEEAENKEENWHFHDVLAVVTAVIMLAVISYLAMMDIMAY